MYDIRNNGRSPGRTPSFHLSKQHEYQQIAKTKFSEKVIIPLNLFLTVRFFGS